MNSRRHQIIQRYVEAESESLMKIFNEKVSVVRARIAESRSTTMKDLTRTKKLLKESLTEVGRLKRKLQAVQSEVDIMKSLLPPPKIQEIFLSSCQEADLASLSLCLRLGVEVKAGLSVSLWSGQLEAVRILLQEDEVSLVRLYMMIMMIIMTMMTMMMMMMRMMMMGKMGARVMVTIVLDSRIPNKKD